MRNNQPIRLIPHRHRCQKYRHRLRCPEKQPDHTERLRHSRLFLRHRKLNFERNSGAELCSAVIRRKIRTWFFTESVLKIRTFKYK